MEVKPGYKLTEVGVIPEEWDVVPVGKAGQVIGGRQRSPHHQGVLSKYLRVANVFDGVIDTSDVLEMPFSSTERERFLLREGDILLNEGQSLELVGRSAIYRGDPPDCCFQNTLIRFRASDSTQTEFAQLIFQTYLRTGVFASVALQTTSIAHLGAGRFAALKMPSPPLPEQRVIAEALSDVETLLDALNQVIAKKRDLKQAAMRRLLTGRQRLPRFRGKWVTKNIGEFTGCTSGGTPSTSVPAYWNGPIRWMSSGELHLKTVHEVVGRITEEGLRCSSAKILPVKSVLVGLAGQGKTRGTVAVNHVELCTNQSIAAILPSSAFVPEYLYHHLDARYDELRALSSGDSGRGGLNLSILRSVAVPLPSVEEQAAIAEVLSDMDAELAALEQHRDKTRALKQAMMQELLTGKTRLM